MLKCKITRLAETIWPLVYADVPVMIYGPTGVGKSTVIKNDLVPKIETEFGNTVFHDTRLSTKDIVDGTGMPVIDHTEKATYWTRPAFIPRDDGSMHVFLYDEFGHASIQLQQMSYSLVLDRALGGYKLPANHRIILASNTRQDGGGDNKMLTPLQNRMAHVTVEIDTAGLIEKMKTWGWDSRLVAFLTLRPGEIHNVSQTDPSFSTPRSLEMLNNVMRKLPLDAKNTTIENMAMAVCGEGFTRQFLTFLTNLSANLPKIPEILANPSKAKVPTDPHFQYVVASAIAKNIDAKTASRFAEYLERLMPDIRSMAAHDAIARDPSLSNNKELKNLVLEGSGK